MMDLIMDLWTKEHFIQLFTTEAVMIIIALILNKFIGKKPLKIRMIPFQVLAVILFLSEIGKQYFSLTNPNGYDLYHIPLHVCSLFIPFLPLMSFYNGKHKDAIRVITCAVTTAMVLFMVVYPNLIYGAWNIKNFFKNYFDFHTVFFHNIVIFEFILIVVLRLHHVDHSKSYIKPIVIMAAIFSAAAGIMSQVLDTNYAKFYYCDVAGIGGLVDQLKAALGNSLGNVELGNFIGQNIYVVIWGCLHALFFLMCYAIYRGIDKLNVKRRGFATAEESVPMQKA